MPLEGVYLAVRCQVRDKELTRDQRGWGYVERIENKSQHRTMHADRGWLSRRQYRSSQLHDQFGDGARIIPTNLFGELAELVDRELPSVGVGLERADAARGGGALQAADPVCGEHRHQQPGLSSAPGVDRTGGVLLRPVLAVHRLPVPQDDQRRRRRLVQMLLDQKM